MTLKLSYPQSSTNPLYRVKPRSYAQHSVIKFRQFSTNLPRLQRALQWRHMIDMASQIPRSTTYTGQYQRKYQSAALLTISE